MTLSRGTRLGHYEVVGLVGAGGMGEVYRARDTRLGRDVALKVLPAEVSRDPLRIQRFEREGRAVAAISHPNILAIHDFGVEDDTAFAVMELLEGNTLRQELREGKLPTRKVVQIGAALARGLAAAHAKGIVHRDLKPENVFMTRDGQVKILDFGLAKSVPVAAGENDSQSPTLTLFSEPGTIVGTLGYMSPEQVRGKLVDARSDIFALGVVLYELLMGQRPFEGESTADTAGAILSADPAGLLPPPAHVPPALARVVLRCMEKNPAERFQAVFDVGLALEAATDEDGSRAVPASGRRRTARERAGFVAALALVAAATGLAVLAMRPDRPEVPSFERVTFRRGNVRSARFASDGRTIVYSAIWGENPSEIFVQRLGSPDARSLARGAAVLGVVDNEVNILHGSPPTVARVPLEGGMPRDVLENVIAADWTRDGSRSLVVRQVGDHQELECPIGEVRYRTTGFGQIRSARLSPRGDRIAFIDNAGGDVAYYGDVVVLEPSGEKRVLSKGWDDAGGLAWSADGREVWFTAVRGGMKRALHAVTLGGSERLVASVANTMVLQDIAADGRVLVTHGQMRSETRGRLAGDAQERDLSWLDGTTIAKLSPDGTKMIFEEWGEGGGVLASTYLFRSDGSSPVRLGSGEPLDVSPDWTRVVARVGFRYPDNGLQLVPIGAGDTMHLPRGAIRDFMWAWWHPAGDRLLIVGSEEKQPVKVFVQELPDGLPRPMIPPPGTQLGTRIFSPDGAWFLTHEDDGSPWMMRAFDGAESRAVPGLEPADSPCGWSADGRYLFLVAGGHRFPAQVLRLDLRTGVRESWLTLSPPDRAGVDAMYGCDVVGDGLYYVYFYDRRLYELVVVRGLG